MPQTLLASGDLWLDPAFLRGSAGMYDEMRSEIVWDERFRARKAASFGFPYNYSGLTWPAVPFPPAIDRLRELVAERVGFAPNNCLANYYPNGSSTMGYHRDETDVIVPGTGFAILSLGAERVICFRSETDRDHIERYPLPAGSLLYMSAAVQGHWKHSIPTDRSQSMGRISLTFRQLIGGDS